MNIICSEVKLDTLPKLKNPKNIRLNLLGKEVTDGLPGLPQWSKFKLEDCYQAGDHSLTAIVTPYGQRIFQYMLRTMPITSRYWRNKLIPIGETKAIVPPINI